jgi:hypothetical protein
MPSVKYLVNSSIHTVKRIIKAYWVRNWEEPNIPTELPLVPVPLHEKCECKWLNHCHDAQHRRAGSMVWKWFAKFRLQQNENVSFFLVIMYIYLQQNCCGLWLTIDLVVFQISKWSMAVTINLFPCLGHVYCTMFVTPQICMLVQVLEKMTKLIYKNLNG